MREIVEAMKIIQELEENHWKVLQMIDKISSLLDLKEQRIKELEEVVITLSDRIEQLEIKQAKIDDSNGCCKAARASR